jgi:3-oxoacyl-(acyl-carrier-protein) synthase
LGRIFITGMGVISAIGETVAANHSSLVQGKCGIGIPDFFNSKWAAVLPLGEVKTSTSSLCERLEAGESGITRTSLLALHAFEEAVGDAGLSAAQLSSADTALVGSTTVGGMCMTDQLYHDANKDRDGSVYLSSYDFASVTIYLQKRFALGGIINSINTACSSSANAIMYGARLIKNGFANRAIVGGADSLAKFTINGFNALHILSNEKCKPFDRDRKGLNLGEGAAFLILEKEADLKGRKVYAELTGYGNSTDAYHPSSLSEEGDGPYLSMKNALEIAGLNKNQVDFINAHGTGTENNDQAESRAMIRLFGAPPAFASSKGNIGHTLGAAGAIEAVYSILSLAGGEIYPNLHFLNKIPETGLVPVRNLVKTELNHVMTNSFGFGGNCSSLIFSKA